MALRVRLFPISLSLFLFSAQLLAFALERTGPYLITAAEAPQGITAQAATPTPAFPTIQGISFAPASDGDYQIAVPRSSVWTFGTPARVNPNANDTGYSYLSGTNQIWKFWILPYHYRYSYPKPKQVIVVPSGRSILIPMNSWTNFATRNTPPAQRTFNFVRQAAIASMNEDKNQYILYINGIKVGKGVRVTTNKPFSIKIPVDNILGVIESFAPGYLLNPCATSGLYFLLKNVKPGTYTLYFQVLNGQNIHVNNHTTTLVVSPLWV